MRHSLVATPRRHQAESRTDGAVRSREPATQEEPKLVASPPTCPVDARQTGARKPGPSGTKRNVAVTAPNTLCSALITMTFGLRRSTWATRGAPSVDGWGSPVLGARRPTPRAHEARDYSVQG